MAASYEVNKVLSKDDVKNATQKSPQLNIKAV